MRQALGEIVEPLRRLAEQCLRIGQTAAEADHALARAGAARAACRGTCGGRAGPAVGRARRAPARRARRPPSASAPAGRRRGRSASVSVSWPTAAISGIALAAAARTTTSSLNAQRSSSEPPPRATISTSGRGTGPAARQPVEALDRRGDLPGRELALDQDRPEQDPAREALGEAMQDVPDHRTRGRGHDADHLGQVGQRPLALRRRTDPRPRAASDAPRAAPSGRRRRPAPADRRSAGTSSGSG